MSVTTAPTMTTTTSAAGHHPDRHSHPSPLTLAAKVAAGAGAGSVTGPTFPLELVGSRAGSESPLATPVDADPYAPLGGGAAFTFPPGGIRQDPLQVTLGATSLFALALLLGAAVHFADRALVEAVLALVPVGLLVRNDYRNYLALGPGGTPSTFSGYCRIAWFRLWAIRDPFSPPSTPGSSLATGGKLDAGVPLVFPARGILCSTTTASPASTPSASYRASSLPYRPGPRPVVAGIAPQRQVDQRGTLPCYRSLRAALERAAATHPSRLGTARSCLEKHGLGLFALHPVNVTCNGEVCHVHDSDRSLHMNLHPDDIAEVLLKGWGQRHPLASDGWWGPMPVRKEFVMVYAPRDEHELRVVCRIIEAAIWFAMAEEIELEPVIVET